MSWLETPYVIRIVLLFLCLFFFIVTAFFLIKKFSVKEIEQKTRTNSLNLKELLFLISDNEFRKAYSLLKLNIKDFQDLAKFHGFRGDISQSSGFREFMYFMAAKDDVVVDLLKFTPRKFYFLDVLDKEDWFKYMDSVLTYKQLNDKLETKQIEDKRSKI